MQEQRHVLQAGTSRKIDVFLVHEEFLVKATKCIIGGPCHRQTSTAKRKLCRGDGAGVPAPSHIVQRLCSQRLLTASAETQPFRQRGVKSSSRKQRVNAYK